MTSALTDTSWETPSRPARVLNSKRPSSETGAIRKVEVIKNNTYIHTQKGNGAELSFTYIDNDVREGESYYYIRVEQEDGELAWASPVWVTYKK